ncbi:hypothetical protein IZY60_06625 [Lutibacter sp. B2]|nr:hypothetical protein [Lutibacter sp. B2]
MKKMAKFLGVSAVLIILTIMCFPVILFFIIPAGVSDHINIKTNTGEKFYFEGSIENTFPKLYGYKYAIYEIRNGKKVLMKSGESGRNPEFYIDEENFSVKDDVVSTMYTYQNENYTMHQIENFILYKKDGSEKYKYVSRENLVDAHRKDTFLYEPIKERFEKYGEGGDLKFLMEMEKREGFQGDALSYEEIIKDLKKIYKQNEDKYMKEFHYRYEIADYNVGYNNTYLEEFIVYEKDHHKYEMVWLKELFENPKAYGFLKPVIAENIQKDEIDKDKLKFLIEVNTVEENKKIMERLSSVMKSDDHLNKLNYKYDGVDYTVIHSRWGDVFYCKDDQYYDVLNIDEVLEKVEEYAFLCPLFVEKLKSDRVCREYETADFLIKADYKEGFEAIIKRYDERLKELKDEGGEDRMYNIVKKERAELIKRMKE